MYKTMIMAKTSFSFLLVLTLALFSGCTNDSHEATGNDSSTGQLAISLTWEKPPSTDGTEVETVLSDHVAGVMSVDFKKVYIEIRKIKEGSVSPPYQFEKIESDFVAENTGNKEFSLDYGNYIIAVYGLDASSRILYRGEEGNPVILSKTNPDASVSITMRNYIPQAIVPTDKCVVPINNMIDLKWNDVKYNNNNDFVNGYKVYITENKEANPENEGDIDKFDKFDIKDASTTSISITKYDQTTLYWYVQVKESGIENKEFDTEVEPTPKFSGQYQVFFRPTANAGEDQSIVSGESVAIGGNPTAKGGTPPYKYEWNHGGLAEANPSVSPTETTTYTVTVTDHNKCPATDTVVVTVIPRLTANAGKDQSIVSGASVTIGGDPTASGGTPGPDYKYKWSSNSGDTVKNEENPSVSPLVTTTYTVTVTDYKGFTAIDDVKVQVVDPLKLSLSGDKTISPETPTVITATVSGGTKDYTYDWSNSTAGTPGTGNVNTFTANRRGKVEVTVTDNGQPPQNIERSITITYKPLTRKNDMEFVFIEFGKFTMGSPDGSGGDAEPGRGEDETPHQVTLSAGYYLQTKEVTRQQWEKVMETDPSIFPTCGDCPVENVSYNNITDEKDGFIKKLNDSDKEYHYRLPTEAEWEYACRAGSITAFAGGDIAQKTIEVCDSDPILFDPILNDMGWYCSNSKKTTQWVGVKNCNEWGLWDMHGNVSEWCSDWYANYTAESVSDPNGPDTGSTKVIRGGSYDSFSQDCRSAKRDSCNPEEVSPTIGFRLVVEKVSD